MNQDRDYAAILAWTRGTLRPAIPFQNVQLTGPRIVDTNKLTWDRFACFYPDVPTYRLYSAPGTPATLADRIRSEIAGLALPSRVPAEYDYAKTLRTFAQIRPLTVRIGIPLGMYIMGHYRTAKGPRGNKPIGVLWHIESLPSAFVLERLKHVATG